MTPFTRLDALAVPLLRDNIDTDMIIRIERLVRVPRREIGQFAFAMLRLRADGSADPACVLNAPRYEGAQILVAGRNFGCGSSREAAVWALAGYGIRAVIALGLGDIFCLNCVKNGILAITLPPDDHARVVTALDAAPVPQMSLDLEAQVLVLPDATQLAFAVGAAEREQLISGEDDLTRTLAHRGRIDAHFSHWHAETPWAGLTPEAIIAFDSDDQR